MGQGGQVGQVGQVGRVGIAALKRCATFIAAVLLVAQGFSPAQGLEVAQGFSPAIAQPPLSRLYLAGGVTTMRRAGNVNGITASTIGDIRRIDTVFKQGVGFDPAKLIASVAELVGIY